MNESKFRPEVVKTDRTYAQASSRVSDLSAGDPSQYAQNIGSVKPLKIKKKSRQEIKETKDWSELNSWAEDPSVSVLLIDKFNELADNDTSNESLLFVAQSCLTEVESLVNRTLTVEDVKRALKETVFGKGAVRKNTSPKVESNKKPVVSKKEIIITDIFNVHLPIIPKQYIRSEVVGEEFELCKLNQCPKLCLVQKYENKGFAEDNNCFIAACSLSDKDEFELFCPQKQPLPEEAQPFYDILIEGGQDPIVASKLALKAYKKTFKNKLEREIDET